MKSIAGSIVFLAGVVAACSAMAVDAFAIRPDGATELTVGGVVLVLFGVGLIVKELVEEKR